MFGVALVGYSGSLIKDAVKEAVVQHLARALDLQHDPSKKAIEDPEVTKVLVGEYQRITILERFTQIILSEGIFFVLFAQVLYVMLLAHSCQHLFQLCYLT